MKSRVLSGVLLTSFLALGAADTAFAEHNKRCRDGDRYRPARSDGQCGQVMQRIAHDRSLIQRWSGTGRHQKVVRWAHEDLGKAQRKLEECRYGARYGDRYDYDRGYDPYDVRGYDPREYDPRAYDPRGYDPSYGGGLPLGAYGSVDGSFDFKRDWPYLLGGVLGAYSGR